MRNMCDWNTEVCAPLASSTQIKNRYWSFCYHACLACVWNLHHWITHLSLSEEQKNASHSHSKLSWHNELVPWLALACGYKFLWQKLRLPYLHSLIPLILWGLPLSAPIGWGASRPQGLETYELSSLLHELIKELRPNYIYGLWNEQIQITISLFFLLFNKIFTEIWKRIMSQPL